jgi:hypothetical protein
MSAKKKKKKKKKNKKKGFEKFINLLWLATKKHVKTSMIFISVVEGTLIPTSVGASSSKSNFDFVKSASHLMG